VPLDAAVEVRAGELVAAGFRPLDALHVAFAERAQARWFVTCDNELLRMAGRLGDALRTLVVAPLAVASRIGS
jgi:predicted nucleic acid-binding protein